MSSKTIGGGSPSKPGKPIRPQNAGANERKNRFMSFGKPSSRPRRTTPKSRESITQFAICIATDDPDLLTPRRIYEVLPDENAVKSNYVRIIDNEGEDYLYPAKYFVFVSFAPEIKRAILQAA
jgi:hypothetical protein